MLLFLYFIDSIISMIIFYVCKWFVGRERTYEDPHRKFTDGPWSCLTPGHNCEKNSKA